MNKEKQLQERAIQELSEDGWQLEEREYDIMPHHSQYGKGDLLFKNIQKELLVVETKYIDFPDTTYLLPDNKKTIKTRQTKNRKKAAACVTIGVCFGAPIGGVLFSIEVGSYLTHTPSDFILVACVLCKLIYTK